MTELKTLKDFIWLGTTEQFALKQEAIKWVKTIYKDKPSHYGVKLFMNFFNFTEADLQ